MKLPENLTKKIGVVAAVFLVGAIANVEGRRHKVYYDIGGVPTVCEGITGEGVVPGKTYSDAECDAMIAQRLDELAAKTLACVHVPLSIHETVAWVHFSYNVGPAAFCQSTAVHLLNAGDHLGACRQIMRWTWVAGKDCRIAENNCHGIVVRRDREEAMCEGQIPVPGDP